MRPTSGEDEAGRARDAGRRAARWKDLKIKVLRGDARCQLGRSGSPATSRRCGPRNLHGIGLLLARQHDRRRTAMLFGRQLTDQELLARLYQATLKLDETSAHARRRLREAQICLRQMQHTDSLPLADTAQKRPS